MTATTTAPSEALVAAAPVLISALTYVQQAVTTILTGDPALLPARIAPADAILAGQLTLLFPELAVAEEGVAASAATSGITGLIGKLQAIQAAAAAAKAA